MRRRRAFWPHYNLPAVVRQCQKSEVEVGGNVNVDMSANEYALDEPQGNRDILGGA